MLQQIDARFLLAILEEADADKAYDLYDKPTYNTACAQLDALIHALQQVDHDDTVHIHN